MAKTVLTKEEIIHLGTLANLKLSEKEINTYQKQLEQTLDYIKNLQELNTDKVLTTDHTVSSENVFFEDGQRNQRSLSSNQILQNSKNKSNNYFTVKKIF